MTICIREYGFLVTKGLPEGLDREVISETNFEFLKKSAIQPGPLMDAFRLSTNRGQEAIQVQNFVGILSLPTGEQLEIVPKTAIGFESVAAGRRVLLKMLSTVANLTFRESGSTSLMTLDRPWLEALIEQILKAIAMLLRSGLRKDYLRVHAEKTFLRGQLSLSAQLRQRPGKQHHFHVGYDDYSTNRPENRLLRSVIQRLSGWTKGPESQRLCRELLFVMAEVPESPDIRNDLRNWSRGRDMARYSDLLPWIRLILTSRSPIFSAGKWEGISLLFPMEQLFEQYVSKKLQVQIPAPFFLKAQLQSESLVTHLDHLYFRLKPDLTVMRDKQPVSVMDTKWKLIDQSLSDRSKKYGLSQADFYQLFAYGEKYLKGEGKSDLFLIYPHHEKFNSALPPFKFHERLTLWVVPFNLEIDAVEWPKDMGFEFLRVAAKVH